MKRIAHMDLDWEQDEDGYYIAQLPPVPGYPGTWYASVDRFTDISDDDDWYLTIYNWPEPAIFLPKGIPGILFQAKTPEELMNNVEENLTPEMIADALQAMGIEPGDIATASRKADKRTATLDLDWSDQGIPQYEEAPLTFDIPGYEYDHAHSDVAITSQFMDPTFGFAFDIEGLKSPRGEYAQLWNDVDFGIPNGKTVEEMMQAAENITPQEIADALAANNYAPDDATASRKASRRKAHFDLNWEENNYACEPYYYANFPSIPDYTAPGYMTEAIVDTPTVDLNDVYSFTLMLGGINEGGVTSLNTVQLHSDDFGIPYRDTPEEAMQDLENLSMDDIIFVLQQEGCQPYEED